MSQTNIKQIPLWLSLLPSFVLFAGAVVLMLLTRGNASGMTAYWEVFAALVALLSLASGWGQTFAYDKSRLMYLVKQVIYWGGLLGCLWLLNQHGIRAALSAQQYTIVLLYLLALTSVFVALQVDSRLFVFGLFMAFCGYLLAVPQNNIILVEIGKFAQIADAASKPAEMLLWVALFAFIASGFVVMTVRGAILAKHARRARG